MCFAATQASCPLPSSPTCRSRKLILFSAPISRALYSPCRLAPLLLLRPVMEGWPRPFPSNPYFSNACLGLCSQAVLPDQSLDFPDGVTMVPARSNCHFRHECTHVIIFFAAHNLSHFSAMKHYIHLMLSSQAAQLGFMRTSALELCNKVSGPRILSRHNFALICCIFIGHHCECRVARQHSNRRSSSPATLFRGVLFRFIGKSRCF